VEGVVTPGGELRDCMERLCRFLNRGLGLQYFLSRWLCSHPVVALPGLAFP